MNETQGEGITNYRDPRMEILGDHRPEGKGDRKRTIIYYFTGTGNSLSAAKRIGIGLGNCELVPILSVPKDGTRIVPEVERIGLVFPVYRWSVPSVVIDLLDRLDLSKAKYIFAVATMGGMGVSALKQLDALLRSNSNRRIDASFALKMPGNFPPIQKPPQGKKREEILTQAEKRIGVIVHTIQQGKRVAPGSSPFSSLLQKVTSGPSVSDRARSDSSYKVDDRCTGCGLCKVVCPVNNIDLTDDRPQWLHKCESCAACLNFCPTQAIQMKVILGTEGRGRYRHPDLRIEDMREQKGIK